jgi:hypothetical protein
MDSRPMLRIAGNDTLALDFRLKAGDDVGCKPPALFLRQHPHGALVGA